MNQIEELFGLFQKLNHSVNDYIFSCKSYKTALKISSESEGNTEKDAEIHCFYKKEIAGGNKLRIFEIN